MKVAPSRDEEALLSGDAAITVGLLTVVTAVERFEAHQAKTLERRADLLLQLTDDQRAAILAASRGTGQGWRQTWVRSVDEESQDLQLGLSVEAADHDARDDFHSDTITRGKHSGQAGYGIMVGDGPGR